MGENKKICLNKRLLEYEKGICRYGGQQWPCFISQWISPLSPIVDQTFHVHTDFLECGFLYVLLRYSEEVLQLQGLGSKERD
jgi:hypothetical protein